MDSEIEAVAPEGYVLLRQPVNLDDLPDFRKYKSSRDKRDVLTFREGVLEGYEAAIQHILDGVDMTAYSVQLTNWVLQMRRKVYGADDGKELPDVQ